MPYPRSTYNSHPQSPGSYSGSNSGSRSHRHQRGARSHDGRSSFRKPSPFPEPRRAEENRAPHVREAPRTPRSTYGTYILPLEVQGQYRTMDPTTCGCNCCPHPTSISGGHEHRYQETSNSRSKVRPSSNGQQRSSSSRHRSSDNHNNHHNHNHDYHGNYSSSSNNNPPNFSRKRQNSQGRYLVDVVDKSSGTLSREYGRFYPISLNQHSTTSSVEAFLVPDRRRAKVLVHWINGQTERLGSGIPMQELLRHADYLEVKDKKQVHWA
ncbi:hypothetical protein BHE90_013120 [Fusarium euwallaceae]|uniref:Uncharacterized protein n=1 Tax=Fusarium euwallaceae TaxID=1147111 RepID=A0A430L9Q5_9HYPO|nr:hypothetical protein BHE90_013120 [Fusarium euwallaceae]